MAARHSAETRQRFMTLIREEVSLREACRAVGISPGTGKRWVDAALTDVAEVQDQNKPLADLLRGAVVSLLNDLGHPKSDVTAKGARDIAAAIGVLHQRYSVETGKTTESRVTVTKEGEDEFDKALRKLLKSESEA